MRNKTFTRNNLALIHRSSISIKAKISVLVRMNTLKPGHYLEVYPTITNVINQWLKIFIWRFPMKTNRFHWHEIDRSPFSRQWSPHRNMSRLQPERWSFLMDNEALPLNRKIYRLRSSERKLRIGTSRPPWSNRCEFFDEMENLLCEFDTSFFFPFAIIAMRWTTDIHELEICPLDQ